MKSQTGAPYALALAVAFGLPAETPAEQLVLTPLRDTTLSEDDVNFSNGAGPFAFIGTTAGGRRRALLKFDLSALPVGAQIMSAQLRFYIDKNGAGSGVDTAVLHRVFSGWDEGSSFATGGGLALATAMDATWQYRVYGNPPAIPRIEWSALGGDFSTSVSATTTIVSGGPYTFSSTPTLVADLQGWHVDPTTNHGWAVLGPEDGRSQTARRILSRESSAVANRPTLIIDYALYAISTQKVPLPLWSSLLLGVLLCAARGRATRLRSARAALLRLPLSSRAPTY